MTLFFVLSQRVGTQIRRAEERLVGQGCAQLDINEEEGIILAGGVWERGQKVAWVPLERPGIPLLEVIGTLEEPRRWRPGVGRIAGRLAIAGGGDWGSNTVEILDQDNRFKLLNHRLEERRENTAAVTVDSSFFPNCRI